MKIFCTSVLLLMASVANACGWYPESELAFFYNIMDQTHCVAEPYHPFLRDDDARFFEGKDAKDFDVGNLMLWKQLLPEWSLETIRLALKTDSESSFEKCWQGHSSPMEIRVKRYMEFARKCSNAFAYRNELSWEYDRILKQQPKDFSSLLTEGLMAFSREKEEQLKMRYGYQVVRIFHYGKQYREAVDFYEQKIKLQKQHTEIYYYLLDQVAGCYYSLEDFERAAYLFLQVFTNSRDRKASAFISYDFCENKDATGKSFFTGKDDEIAYITLRSVSSFSDEKAGLKTLVEMAPEDERTALLFTRILNNLERKIWPTEIGMKSKTLPLLEDATLKHIHELENVATLLYENPKVTDKEHWQLVRSYLAFLKGDLKDAGEKLAVLKDKRFNQQKEILEKIYKVFSWEKIGEAEEHFLAGFLHDVVGVNTDLEELDSNWKHLVVERVAHLYYQNNLLAKSFLLHNEVSALVQVFSLPLLDDLRNFAAKENKHAFEQMLAAGMTNETVNYLDYLKGLYYLQEAEPELALPFLDTPSMNVVDNERRGIEAAVSARIFSNNTKECFNCDPLEVMVDSVFLTEVFTFIKPKFSKFDLANNLLELETLTKDEKHWKRKLAHYLLGNYYFNISNTGYFRGTLSGMDNCCDYNYFQPSYYEYFVAADLIETRSGYNLFGVGWHSKTYHGFQQIAKKHYRKVMEYSTDKELNARCLYMMAKCELNEMYNTYEGAHEGADGSVSEEIERYKTSFRELRDNYKDTRFYDLIIRECSFFKYYCSL